MKKMIQWFSWWYTALLICGGLVGVVIGLTSTYGVLPSVGCTFSDALLYGVDCRGFFGAKAIEILVSFPLFIVQLSVIFFLSPIGFVFVLMLWLPVLASIYWLIKRLKSHSKLLSQERTPELTR